MNIQEIKVSECAAFQDNPFQVRDDEGMELLVQSIKEFGVMTPVVVRPVKEGGYEIVSGHHPGSCLSPALICPAGCFPAE